MKIIKLLLVALFLIGIIGFNISVVADSNPTIYNSGYKLKDWEGNVIGCECPYVNGTCICATKPAT